MILLPIGHDGHLNNEFLYFWNFNRTHIIVDIMENRLNENFERHRIRFWTMINFVDISYMEIMKTLILLIDFYNIFQTSKCVCCVLMLKLRLQTSSKNALWWLLIVVSSFRRVRTNKREYAFLYRNKKLNPGVQLDILWIHSCFLKCFSSQRCK